MTVVSVTWAPLILTSLFPPQLLSRASNFSRWMIISMWISHKNFVFVMLPSPSSIFLSPWYVFPCPFSSLTKIFRPFFTPASFSSTFETFSRSRCFCLLTSCSDPPLPSSFTTFFLRLKTLPLPFSPGLQCWPLNYSRPSVPTGSGFWYPWGVLEPMPHGSQGTIVVSSLHDAHCFHSCDSNRYNNVFLIVSLRYSRMLSLDHLPSPLCLHHWIALVHCLEHHSPFFFFN